MTASRFKYEVVYRGGLLLEKASDKKLTVREVLFAMANDNQEVAVRSLQPIQVTETQTHTKVIFREHVQGINEDTDAVEARPK